MPSRVVLLRPSRGASCFVSLPSVVLRRRETFPCSLRAKDAYCGRRRSNAHSVRPALVTMVVDGYDSTKIHDPKRANGGSVDPATGEEQLLLTPRDDDSTQTASSGGLDMRLVFAGGALLVLTAVILVAVGTGALSGDSFVILAQWFESRGNTTAIVLYALLYFVLELVAVPATPLTLGAGYIFGIPLGSVVMSVSSTAAATAAFLISRYWLRNYISSVATKYPRFRAMDRAIGREGFKFVFLLRLSPLLPFSISNYLYGLTSVNLMEYVLGSWLGMMPGTIAYVSAGAAIDAVTDLTGKKSTVNPVLVGIGVLATIAVLFFVGRLAANVVEAEGELNESV